MRIARFLAPVAVTVLLAVPVSAQHHSQEMASADLRDVVDTAVEAGRFNTLVAAVQAAGLVETLKGEGPFTVFAPTDDAFAALPEGTLESLLKPENQERLRSILLYHVVPGRVTSSEVVNLSSADTALGRSLSVEGKDGAVYVGGAKVVAADVEASNGVIHVIDRVLLPESD